MRPRVLLVALPNSYRIGAYVAAAQRLGLDILVVSEGEHSLVSAVAAGLHLNLRAPDALERLMEAVAGGGVAGVVATDDATVELAGGIAAKLALPHNPPKAARLSRRKDLARIALTRVGLPVPEFTVLDLRRPLAPQLDGIRFPCVVKPVALSASRGVIRADDPDGLQAACERIRAILAEEGDLTDFESRTLLVEAFIPGREVALEGMLEDGRLRVLALFDKPDPLDGPYFEETYYVMPGRLSGAERERVEQRVQQACHAYGLRHGPVHGELRLSADGEAWILEVASRTIGGQCARLLRFGTGYGLEELVLAQAVGRRLEEKRMDGGAAVLMIPTPRAGVLRRVEGVLAARNVPYVEDLEISIRDGYELVPLPEGGRYLGFIFARAPDPYQAEAALRRAHAELRVVVAPVLTRQPVSATVR